MLKQYVFLVHGMGFQLAGEWHTSFVDSMVKALRSYAPYDALSKAEIEADHFRFLPISYDSVFEGYRNRWRQNIDGVRDQVSAQDEEVGRIFEWLAESMAADSGVEGFFWENLLDPLLWFGFPEARKAVMAHVNDQIGQGLMDMYAQERTNTAHIVAHSLGTSVIHDSLVGLRFWPDHEGLFDPESHQWRTVGMIANVSRLLQTRFILDTNLTLDDFDPHRSVLGIGRTDAICQNFLNAHHRIDPFTWPRPFRPRNWPTHAYRDVETTRFDEAKKVHDFETYLANPFVHLPLLRLISGRVGLGTADEQTQVLGEFQATYDKEAGQEFEHLKGHFSGDPERRLGIKEFASYLKDAIEELT